MTLVIMDITVMRHVVTAWINYNALMWKEPVKLDVKQDIPDKRAKKVSANSI